MNGRSGPGRSVAAPVAALVAVAAAAFASGCSSFNEQPSGFVGVGCYDHRNRIEPTIRTQGECRAAAWVWRTEPWQTKVPAPVPGQ